MRLFPLLALLAACGPKAPPPAPEAPPAPAPPPERTYEPAPTPPAAPQPNADFRMTLHRADGSTETGRVVRIERGIDFYGVRGMTDQANKITIALSRDGQSRDAQWTELSSIQIRYDTDPAGISCTYDSAVTPWAYICTLPTTTTATTTDGAQWDVTTRNVWQLTTADDTVHELYLFKLPVREEDTSGAGRRNIENPEMYPRLRDAVLAEAATAVTRIEINP